MQKRAVRFTVLALLLAAGAGAALVVSSIATQIAAVDATGDDVSARLDQILTSINDIGAAQHAYVAPGQPAQAAFEQVAGLIQRINADLQGLRPHLQSVEAAELLTMMSDATATLVDADGSARSHYRTGQTLWAAEVVFGQARDTLATMTQAVRALEAAETRARSAMQAGLQQTLWTVAGGAGALWALGLFALAWTPRPSLQAPTMETLPVETRAEPARGTADRIDELPPLDIAPPATATTPPPPAIDLVGAAGVCTGISRLNRSDALPGLLAEAARVLDASGIIVWMGAGDALFPAAAHGYDARILSRVGSIPRGAENATAAAWRACEVRTVPADMMANGAVVAPMFGPDGCIGVLAVEVRHGREADPATQSVTAIIAAQLSTVVTAWPAASATPAAGAVDAEAPPLREASGL